MVSVLLLAFALALDAAAVSAGVGAAQRSLRPLVLAAVLFGLFQAGMSALGALAGGWLEAHAAAWDHWIAFVLLTAVGLNMLRGGDDEEAVDTRLITLLTLAVATSIDALAAGVTLPLLDTPLAVSLAVIGVVTLGLSLVAGYLGRRAGDLFGPVVEKLGAVVLIGIGVRILVSHLMA